MKIRLIASSIAAGLLLAPVAGQAQDFPSKPIHLVVPFSAGGTTDTLARIMADEMAKSLGVTFVVENKPGASGVIGLTAVAHAAADGYTIGLASPGSTSIATAMGKDLPYDVLKDFTFVSPVAYYDNALVVSADFPVNSVQELIKYSKEHPGKLTYGGSSIGSSTHLQGEMLKRATGLDMEHVAFKGGGEQIQALVGGHIKIGVIGLSATTNFIKEGQLRALAVLNTQRAAAVPDVPAITEEVPGYDPSMNWYGMVAPKGIPQEAIDRLNAAIQDAVRNAEAAEKASARGIELFGGSPKDLADLVAKEVAGMKEAVDIAGIRQQ